MTPEMEKGGPVTAISVVSDAEVEERAILEKRKEEGHKVEEELRRLKMDEYDFAEQERLEECRLMAEAEEEQRRLEKHRLISEEREERRRLEESRLIAEEEEERRRLEESLLIEAEERRLEERCRLEECRLKEERRRLEESRLIAEAEEERRGLEGSRLIAEVEEAERYRAELDAAEELTRLELERYQDESEHQLGERIRAEQGRSAEEEEVMKRLSDELEHVFGYGLISLQEVVRLVEQKAAIAATKEGRSLGKGKKSKKRFKK